MNGIIAKGIELPRCCDICDMRRIYNKKKPSPCPAVSASLVRHTSDAFERRPGCPLEPLPDKPGQGGTP